MRAFCLWTKHSDENNRFVSTKCYEKDPATSMIITRVGENATMLKPIIVPRWLAMRGGSGGALLSYCLQHGGIFRIDSWSACWLQEPSEDISVHQI